ncbi:hypothetical protein [Sporosarcina sp.]|uniref:hypothetical protein n=1 Tax=Sporosarcina sp. TaxID=49982 RepID=UPI00260549EB|nr:hypothetical protein [Sporosarcina sp.]
MKFFKKMNDKESSNWRSATILGFYTYMLVSACNYFYYILSERILISPPLVFGSGLLAAVVYEFILNRKS